MEYLIGLLVAVVAGLLWERKTIKKQAHEKLIKAVESGEDIEHITELEAEVASRKLPKDTSHKIEGLTDDEIKFILED